LIIIFLAQGLSARKTEKMNFKEIGLWLKEMGYQGSGGTFYPSGTQNHGRRMLDTDLRGPLGSSIFP
jgi:hypothetical protein